MLVLFLLGVVILCWAFWTPENTANNLFVFQFIDNHLIAWPKASATRNSCADKGTVQTGGTHASTGTCGEPLQVSSPRIQFLLQQPMNINNADTDEFALLSGIGPALAKRIVAYREHHGNFASVDDLIHVAGIGPKKLRQIKTSCPLTVQ